jgi:hypothetical protein
MGAGNMEVNSMPQQENFTNSPETAQVKYHDRLAKESARRQEIAGWVEKILYGETTDIDPSPLVRYAIIGLLTDYAFKDVCSAVRKATKELPDHDPHEQLFKATRLIVGPGDAWAGWGVE